MSVIRHLVNRYLPNQLVGGRVNRGAGPVVCGGGRAHVHRGPQAQRQHGCTEAVGGGGAAQGRVQETYADILNKVDKRAHHVPACAEVPHLWHRHRHHRQEDGDARRRDTGAPGRVRGDPRLQRQGRARRAAAGRGAGAAGHEAARGAQGSGQGRGCVRVPDHVQVSQEAR